MSIDWDEINSKLPFARTKVYPPSRYCHHRHQHICQGQYSCWSHIFIKTMTAHNIIMLPSSRSWRKTSHHPSNVQEDYEARKELWEAVDVNGNGFLSLAEVTKVVIVIIIILSLWSSSIVTIITTVNHSLPWLPSLISRVWGTWSLLTSSLTASLPLTGL